MYLSLHSFNNSASVRVHNQAAIAAPAEQPAITCSSSSSSNSSNNKDSSSTNRISSSGYGCGSREGC
ncbi:hypothetical protein Emag_002685 [Eimeria magna]